MRKNTGGNRQNTLGTDVALEMTHHIVSRFEEVWRNGGRPDLAEFLLEDSSQRLVLLAELVAADLWWRIQKGEKPRVADYVKRFPELAGDQSACKRLALDEQRYHQEQPRDETAAEQITLPGYDILGELGRGGMGVVYKARQVATDRIVALKLLRESLGIDSEERNRFLAEAEAIARLSHPNVVQIYEVGKHREMAYFSLEFCAGGSLLDHLAGKTLAARPAAALVQTLAQALHAMHQVGIVHRDLKPANVLLASPGPESTELTPKITDFGLAKRIDRDSGATRTGQVMGTPSYMAPEQARGLKTVGPAVDVYALGAILYECLTGQPPFVGGIYEILAMVVAEDPMTPKQRNPQVPADLNTICLKCLRKNPEERYRTAIELADDLHRFLTGNPISARPVGLVERGIKWARRRPTTAALFGAVILAGSISGLYGVQQFRQARWQQETQARMGDLWARAEKADLNGQLARAQGHNDEARQFFTDARGAMEGALAILEARRNPDDEELQRTIARRLEEVRLHLEDVAQSQRDSHTLERGRRELQEKLAQLGENREELLFLELPSMDEEQLANRTAIRQLAPAALVAFGLDVKKGAASPENALGHLQAYFRSDEQRQRAALWCCEILLCWAEAEANQAAEQPESERLAGTKQALALLDLAGGLLTGQQLQAPRTWHERRAQYLTILGDASGAASARDRAREHPAKTALDQYLLALGLFRKGKLEETVTACEQAMRLQPDAFAPLYLLAVCRLKQKSWADADAWLTACLSRRPELFWPRLQRATARVERKDLSGARSDLEEAEKRATSTVARFALYLTRARLAFVAQQWESARDDFLAAIRCQPVGEYRTHLNLAQVYRQLKDYPAAVAELDTAIKKAKEDGQLYYTRARVYLEMKSGDKARSDLERAAQLGTRAKPRWLRSALVELGHLKHEARDYEAALADCHKAIQLDEKYAPAHRQLAESLLALQRDEEAGQALDAYLALARPDAEVHRARGVIYSRLRDHTRAIAAYSRSLELKPSLEVLAFRGIAYLQTRVLPAALADFDEVLKRSPTNIDALCGRAQVHVLMGKTAEALKDAEQASKLGKPTVTLLCSLACIHARVAAGLDESARNAGRRPPQLVRQHEDRAVNFLAEALQKVPSRKRAEFWREKVERDLALRPLLRHPEMVRLYRLHAE